MSHTRQEVGYSAVQRTLRTYKPIPQLTVEQLEVFWSRVDRSSPSGCWLWTGSKRKGIKGKNYYGVFYVGRDSFAAHRIAYAASGRHLPDDHTLDHLRESGICTATLCINPDHLEPVSQSENTKRYRASLPRICKRGHQMEPTGNCKACIDLKLAEWLEKNRDKNNDYRREWYAANKERISEQRRQRYKTRKVAA